MKKLICVLCSIVVVLCATLMYHMFVNNTTITEFYINEYEMQDGYYTIAMKNAIDSLISYDRRYGCNFDGENCKIDVFFDGNADVIDCLDETRLFEPKIMLKTHHTSWRGHRDDNLGVAIKGLCVINGHTCYIYDKIALDSLFIPTGRAIKHEIKTSDSVVYCEENNCWILKVVDGYSFEYVMNSYSKDSCFSSIRLSSTDEDKVNDYINKKNRSNVNLKY